MNDFATEEFLNKNIRVRPMSGVSKGDDEGKTNDAYNKSLNDPYGQGGDDDEKNEQIMQLEIQEKRH